MDFSILLQGAVLGFSIAAPVGPIGVLCIRRTLAEGWSAGLVSGLGAASADALYGCVAAFGLTAVSAMLVGSQVWLRPAGGVFLCYLGLRTFLARPAEHPTEAGGQGLARSYVSALLLTLTNPITILAFAAVFAGLGFSGRGSGYLAAGLLVLGVFGGSTLWWLALSSAVALFRGRFGSRAMRWVNRLSGLVITGFGLGALLGGR